MEGGFVLTFPAYVPLVKDASGIMFMRHGEEIWMPLFTDRPGIETFIERSGIPECVVVELASPEELSAFLQHHPCRTGKPFDGKVVVDLMDNRPRMVNLFTVRELLSQLPA